MTISQLRAEVATQSLTKASSLLLIEMLDKVDDYIEEDTD